MTTVGGTCEARAWRASATVAGRDSRLLMPPILALLIVGCDANPSPAAAGCDLGDTESGRVIAVIDGEDWASTTEFLEAGTSLQVNAPTTGGWWFSMVLQTSSDGATAVDAVAAGVWPIVFDVGGVGGWVTLYPETGDSYTSRDAVGEVTLVGADDGLAGCFAFDAAGSGGTVSVTGGRFVAVPSSLR